MTWDVLVQFSFTSNFCTNRPSDHVWGPPSDGYNFANLTPTMWPADSFYQAGRKGPICVSGRGLASFPVGVTLESTEFKQSSKLTGDQLPIQLEPERETKPTWVWLRKTRPPSGPCGALSPSQPMLSGLTPWAGKTFEVICQSSFLDVFLMCFRSRSTICSIGERQITDATKTRLQPAILSRSGPLMGVSGQFNLKVVNSFQLTKR